jgi:hypothetical protein
MTFPDRKPPPTIRKPPGAQFARPPVASARMNKTVRFLTALAVLGGAIVSTRADEHLFGYVRGAETLPKGHADLYQFVTLRTGKDRGSYYGWDSDTEVEYGFTDKFQMGFAVVQHFFDIDDVPDLREGSFYKFGGVELSGKYRFKSVFKDGYGLAYRQEVAYLRYDDVAGIIQEEIDFAPELIFQKNFLDDTLIFAANAGTKFAWGKKPAEEYDYEITFQGAAGLSYRFAPNWFFGPEAHMRSEFPEFDFGFHEHSVIFVGPALHYGAKNWWGTFSYAYQIWGEGVDEPSIGKTYAEEARNEFRLKVGFNF